MSRHRWLLRVALLSLGLSGWPGDSPAGPVVALFAPAEREERLFIRVAEGRLSATIEGASLAEVLAEIGARTGVDLALHGSRTERVSARFQSLPLEEALRRLLRENFLLTFSGTDNRVEVWIVSRHSSSPAGNSADSLLQHLRVGDAELRREAVWELGDRVDGVAADPRARVAVTAALRTDEDAEVRRRAAWLLESSGDPEAVAALAKAAAQDQDESVRQRAIESLARIGGHEAIALLSSALREDPDPSVRFQALVSLTEDGGNQVEDSILEALSDPDELVPAKAEELREAHDADGLRP
jgi:HEAT repeat protein